MKTIAKNLALSAGILAAAFVLMLALEQVFDTDTTTPMVFVLAVFLVSRFTEGYMYGILAAAVSMLAVNYAFTFPYFKFNFTIPENLFSGIVMLFVAIMTSALTTSLKGQEHIRSEMEAEKVRANLLRAVSHDLRTPLTTIYGSCSTIVENYDTLDKSQQIKLLTEVCDDAQWLSRMVENLLSVTRVDSASVSLEKTSTVLEELIDAVVLKFRNHYPGQALQVEIPDDFVSIPMDSILIEQVLMNLLENAVHHAEGMTSLLLRVSIRGRRAVFEVIDDGCGMSRERLSGIFSGSLAEGDASQPGIRRGMGIGLSVCATIVRAHGGDIQAQSISGKGTTVRFFLNMEDSPDE